jgi:flagellar basal body-associated protein FliL
MSLNLNKGGEENSKPSAAKKSLNLSKSGDTAKAKLNLTKDNPVPYDDSKSSNIQTNAKKKSPTLIIALAVIIIGIGVFWLMNKNNTNQNQTETVVNNEVPVTAPSEANTSQTTDGTNITAGDTDQTSEVNSSPSPSTESPSVNENTANSTETSTPNTNQSSTANGVPSSNSTLQSGSIEDKARQVLTGAFGNGVDRKRALGDQYEAIQAKVNELYRDKLQ